MSQNQLILIRERLELMEDSIVFLLIERSRYRNFPEEIQFFEENRRQLKKTLNNSQDFFSENVEKKLISFYFNKILSIKYGDKELPITSLNFKNSVLLELVKERLEIGKLVAAAKFQMETELYRKLIKDKNINEINKQLTNAEVEQKILVRIEEKAKHFNFINPNFNPEVAVLFYKDCVIPLTKEIELEYLLAC